MKKESYKSLEIKRSLVLGSFTSYLEFAMNKEKDWKIDTNMVLKYGLISELMFNYFRNLAIQNQYADALVEQIKTIAGSMEAKYFNKYKEEYHNEAMGCNASVITVNKILNSVPVNKKEVMSAFIEIASNGFVQYYMKDKFKGIDVLSLLEVVYNKFPEKIANEKVR